MKLADSLKSERKKRGLSQKEFADKLGINARTYASYERGERDISTAVLLNICKTLNVSSDELLGNNIQPSSSVEIDNSNSESLLSDLPKKVVSKKFKGFDADNISVNKPITIETPDYLEEIFMFDQLNDLNNPELKKDQLTVRVIPYADGKTMPVTPFYYSLNENSELLVTYNQSQDYFDELKSLIKKLNENGKKEALKRVRELTFVPEYKKSQEEEQEISGLVQLSDKKQ